jgi:peptide/nickel transport system substrate-binding protein
MSVLTRRDFGRLGGAAALAASLPRPARAAGSKVLRCVMHSGLRITDPIITTAYIARNHGYMIYDTLFAVDDKLQVQPQMVDHYELSADKLTYTFTLRPGLKFHDGAPVTPTDVIASLQRWGKRDGMGQKLMDFTASFVSPDARTFQIVLKEPYGLVLASLGKPSSNVPFIMPARIAATPADQNVAEFQPGQKVVYEKNPDYVPRAEPASSLAGGKRVLVDRVEWINITDYQTAVNALANNEIDFIEQPPHDLLPILTSTDKVVVKNYNPLGFVGTCRMNFLLKPFDNPKIRQAVLHAINQEDYLEAQIGNAEYFKPCWAMFVCGNPDYSTLTGAMFIANTPFATEAGFPAKPDPALAKQLLKEGGYDGTPVVIMQPTDLAIVASLGPVTAQALRGIGMTVDLQSMDWQTLVGRRAKQTPVSEGGWNMFHTTWAAADMLNPVANLGVNARGKNGGWFGWAEDAEVEKLRDRFARETDAAKQKQLAEDVQKRAYDDVMYIPTGQYTMAYAYRDSISGILGGPVPVFWNVDKKSA